MGTANSYRDGKVHVLAEQCSTCIFRPGNPMSLKPGRVKEMVDSSIQQGSAITCHDTLYRRKDGVDNAICRGFWDSYRGEVSILRLAEVVGAVAYDDPPLVFRNP